MTRKERLSVSLPPSVMRWLELKARQEGRSVSNMTAIILAAAMEKERESLQYP